MPCSFFDWMFDVVDGHSQTGCQFSLSHNWTIRDSGWTPSISLHQSPRWDKMSLESFGRKSIKRRKAFGIVKITCFLPLELQMLFPYPEVFVPANQEGVTESSFSRRHMRSSHSIKHWKPAKIQNNGSLPLAASVWVEGRIDDVTDLKEVHP